MEALIRRVSLLNDSLMLMESEGRLQNMLKWVVPLFN
jgi:hypothetical protein